MLLSIPSIGFRFYLGLFLLNSISMETQGTGLNLHCTNDFDRLMLCRFGPPRPDGTNCTEYLLSTRLKTSRRYPERNCNLTPDPVQTGTCSCSLDIGGFVLGDIHNTTLWKAGDLVESKNIPVFDNIKPKAPKVNPVRRDEENGNYVVKWDTHYDRPVFNLTAVVTYHKQGEKGAEAIVSSGTLYHIWASSLEANTDYVVNVRSIASYPSESSEDVRFTTRVSWTTTSVVTILSVCGAAIIITSSLFLLLAWFKTKWWDNVGKYKNSTLLDMVPGEHKVLMPQKAPLCSVYVDARKEDKDVRRTCQGGISHGGSGADSRSSSRGNSEKVSVDIISNVENAMREAFPLVSLPPTTAPRLFRGHSLPQPGTHPVPGTSSLSTFENWDYSMAPPFGPQGLSGALPAVLSESFYNPSTLRGALHDPSPESQVPIFQLTRQRQPLVSTHDSAYTKRADSVSSFPTEALQVDLTHSSSPRDATSSSIWSGVGSSVSAVCSTGALRSETSSGSLRGGAADPSSVTEHVYSQEEPSVEVCGSNPSEEPRPAPACSRVPVDDDYQAFQSVARGAGELTPEASDARPTNRLDKLSETLFTAMPSAVRPFPPSSPGAQGLLQPPDNKVSALPADEHKLVLISDYHQV